MKQGKNYEVLSTANLQLKMSRWRDYRVRLNDGSQINATVLGKQKEFESFCNHCKVCQESCDQAKFLNCINTKKEKDLMVFENRQEAQEFFQMMLFL